VSGFHFDEFVLAPDEAPDARPAEYAFQCLECSAVGPTQPNPAYASGWVPFHQRHHPEHTGYWLVSLTPHRLRPGERP
jgi:hypothetical protein